MSFTSEVQQGFEERLNAARTSQRHVDADRPPVQPDIPPARTPLTDSVWFKSARSVTAWIYRGVCRPQIRLVVIGLVLILVAALELLSSVWTAPLVLVGALMVILAWIGPRLDGRIGILWGEDGTELEMRAHLKPYRPAALTPSPPAPASSVVTKTADAANTIDGEAHTIAIDVAELKALIAAIEAAEAHTTDTPAAETAENGAGESASAAPKDLTREDLRHG